MLLDGVPARLKVSSGYGELALLDTAVMHPELPAAWCAPQHPVRQATPGAMTVSNEGCLQSGIVILKHGRWSGAIFMPNFPPGAA